MPKQTLKNLIEQQYAFYKSIVSVYCPILNEPVYFTGRGFKHLLYESNGAPRNVNEQWLKLKCLEHATLVVKNCTSTTSRKVRLKQKGLWKTAVQYKLVAKISPKITMRVIVEKVGTGKLQFLSIMPHDRISRIPKSKNKAPN